MCWNNLKDSLRKLISMEGINTMASVVFLTWYLWATLHQVPKNGASIVIASVLMLIITLLTHANLLISIFNRKRIIGGICIAMYFAIYYLLKFLFEHHINVKYQIDPEYINLAAIAGAWWYAIFISTFLWGLFLILLGLFKIVDITPMHVFATIIVIILALLLVAIYFFPSYSDNLMSIVHNILLIVIPIFSVFIFCNNFRNAKKIAVFQFNKNILFGFSGYSILSNGIALFCVGIFFLTQAKISERYFILLDSYFYRECANYQENKIDDKYLELYVKKNSKECLKIRLQFDPNLKLLDDGESTTLSENSR